MTASRDPDRLIRAFLAEGRSKLPDRTYDAVRASIDRTHQRAVIGPWGTPNVNTYAKLSIAAAAIVAVAVVGINLLPARGGVGPATSPRPSATALPSGSPTPAAAAYPPGFEIPPMNRQSLTVDGVPFSFRVPTEGWAPGIQLKESDGTSRPRSLYIAKGTTGGQRAEAVIFWTAFPGGVNTDPCPNLLDPRIGPSAADLAAAMATAPGTDLVTGPSDVNLGGRAAKHVVLTVREHLGCDPGYFFTWPDECWGACWIRTEVGDMIGVWVVDVDDWRLVIEAETTEPGVWIIDGDGVRRFVKDLTVMQADVEREIQQIIESIRFE